MIHRYSKYLNTIVLCGDLAVVNLTLFAAYITFYPSLADFTVTHAILAITINSLWVVSSFLLRTYVIPRISKFNQVFQEMMGNVFLNVLTISALLLVLDVHLYLTTPLLFFYALLITGISAWRAVYMFIIHLYRKFGFNYRSFAIIGQGKLSNDLTRFFSSHPEFGYRYLGYFDNEATSPGCLGKIDNLPAYLRENRIDEIYCEVPSLQKTLLNRIVQLGEEHFISVKLITDSDKFQGRELDVEFYNNLPIVEATSFPLEQQKNRFNKRLFDVLFSIIVLLSFCWLFPLIALAIKLESAGPVLFIQRRSGQGNNKFWCLKFRTMYMNDQADKIQATRNDVRVTRVGAILRKTSLDEFPQFFNVLIGNMSVVGPRPYMIHHTQVYSKQLERFMARHQVKPGITGLAQCSGYRGEISTHLGLKNRLKLDYFYISKWSIFLDFSIIFKTIMLLIRGDEKAY